MKQVFLDRDKGVVVKVFPNSKLLEREICGAKNFAPFVGVPKITKLDKKVAQISLLSGFLGYQIDEDDLSRLVADLLGSLKPKIKVPNFSITEEIVNLSQFFKADKKVIQELEQIKKTVSKSPLFPVHGDLQKQNLIISEGKLSLIDFEHFLFAPKELEFCNSLFFDDGNCLNVQKIVAFLPPCVLDQKMLEVMLRFFKLKQIFLGMGAAEADLGFKLALNKARDCLAINQKRTLMKRKPLFSYQLDPYSIYTLS